VKGCVSVSKGTKGAIHMAFPPAFDVAAAVADAVAAISEHSRVIREISCHKYGVASCKSHEKRRQQCTSAWADI
jgi:hypothetical protein